MLIESIMSQLEGMFDTTNEMIGDIAGLVGETPMDWNAGIFNMVVQIADNAILPVAGVILAGVLTYELVQILIERNNNTDFDIVVIYKWLFKAAICVTLLTSVFAIVGGIFEIAQAAILEAGVAIVAADPLSAGSLDDVRAVLENETLHSIGSLMAIAIQMFMLPFIFHLMRIVIWVVILGRFVEIYLAIAIAPIPFATFANREWASIGQNYVKTLAAYGLQGMLIMICVGIYAVLMGDFTAALADPTVGFMSAIWMALGYGVLLCFAILKVPGLAKSLLGAA